MLSLHHWISHRSRILGLPWPEGVSDASGISAQVLEAIAATGSLRHVGRGARGYLARSLKVSLRDLEALAAGRVAWIDDCKVVDLSRQSVIRMERAKDKAPAPAPLPCDASRGISLLGRILRSGHVQHFEDWTPEEGPRIPVRFKGHPDAFALELKASLALERAKDCLVFEPVAPGELQEADKALITLAERDGETVLCGVEQVGVMKLHLRPAGGGKPAVVSTADVLRAARRIGAWAGAGQASTSPASR